MIAIIVAILGAAFVLAVAVSLFLSIGTRKDLLALKRLTDMRGVAGGRRFQSLLGVYDKTKKLELRISQQSDNNTTLSQVQADIVEQQKELLVDQNHDRTRIVELEKGNDNLNENLDEEFARLDDEIEGNRVIMEGMQEYLDQLGPHLVKDLTKTEQSIIKLTRCVSELHREIDRMKPRLGYLNRRIQQLQEELDEKPNRKPAKKKASPKKGK